MLKYIYFDFYSPPFYYICSLVWLSLHRFRMAKMPFSAVNKNTEQIPSGALEENYTVCIIQHKTTKLVTTWPTSSSRQICGAKKETGMWNQPLALRRQIPFYLAADWPKHKSIWALGDDAFRTNTALAGFWRTVRALCCEAAGVLCSGAGCDSEERKKLQPKC